MARRKGRSANGESASEGEKPVQPETLRPPRDQAGISLDQLSDAFAEMFSTGDDPYAVSTADAGEAAESEAAVAEKDDDAHVDVSPVSILEAMLFVGHPDNRPLSSRDVAGLMRGVRPAEIDQLVRELNERYEEDGCPYRVASEASGYRLVLRDEYHRVRDKFYGRVRQARLSPAAIEVLSVVAYNQPVTSEAVANLRGRPSGAILAQLVRRGLLRVERPEEKPRRMRYFTTERFLRLFHLRGIDDLPRSEPSEP